MRLLYHQRVGCVSDTLGTNARRPQIDLVFCGKSLRYNLTYARFSELSSNHCTDLNVGGHHGGYPQ